MTQRSLADRAGVPQSTIGRIEAGLVDPRVGTLDRLLRACGEELDAVPVRGLGVDRTIELEVLGAHPDELA
jgi:predicted transcriptional regulator